MTVLYIRYQKGTYSSTGSDQVAFSKLFQTEDIPDAALQLANKHQWHRQSFEMGEVGPGSTTFHECEFDSEDGVVSCMLVFNLQLLQTAATHAEHQDLFDFFEILDKAASQS